MRIAFFAFILMFSGITIFAQSGSISNINVVPRVDGSGFVDITFDLSGEGALYNIFLEASFGEGALYHDIPGEFLEGDIYKIEPGNAKSIVWDGLMSFPNSYSTDARVKITAIPDGGTVTDADGNVYTTVIIGTHEWMAENLRVTQYNNGDAIPTGLDNTDWENTTDGAYAIYPHSEIDGLGSDAEVVEAYGKLYNWYAVADARGLCPEGWRAPTDVEWTVLVDYVVGQGYPNEWDNTNGAGNALKSCRQVGHPYGGECATLEHPRWNSHDTHYGFDEFGFSALPGGFRFSFGFFYNVGYNGLWWSSTENDATDAWGRAMSNGDGGVGRSGNDKRDGFSVRCVREN